MKKQDVDIIVCVKQIRHTYTRTGMEEADHFLAPEDTVFAVNPPDVSALELALRARDRMGGGSITLLTAGPLIAEKALRACLAMGANRLCRVDVDDSLDPYRKSRVLAGFINRLGADAVLCGVASMDSRNGQVGPLLGHLLDVPYVADVTGWSVVEDLGSAVVQRNRGRGAAEELSCPLPAVLGVGTGRIDLRLPTFSGRQRAAASAMETFRCPNDKVAPRLATVSTGPARPRSRAAPAPDSRLPAHQRIELLLAGSLVEKKGRMLTGPVEDQVEGIVSFLQDRGILRSSKT